MADAMLKLQLFELTLLGLDSMQASWMAPILFRGSDCQHLQLWHICFRLGNLKAANCKLVLLYSAKAGPACNVLDLKVVVDMSEQYQCFLVLYSGAWAVMCSSWAADA